MNSFVFLNHFLLSLKIRESKYLNVPVDQKPDCCIFRLNSEDCGNDTTGKLDYCVRRDAAVYHVSTLLIPFGNPAGLFGVAVYREDS